MRPPSSPAATGRSAWPTTSLRPARPDAGLPAGRLRQRHRAPPPPAARPARHGGGPSRAARRDRSTSLRSTGTWRCSPVPAGTRSSPAAMPMPALAACRAGRLRSPRSVPGPLAPPAGRGARRRLDGAPRAARAARGRHHAVLRPRPQGESRRAAGCRPPVAARLPRAGSAPGARGRTVGDRRRSPHARRIDAREVTLQAIDGEEIPVQADGDVAARPAAWRFEMRPQAVRLIGRWG